MSRADNKRIRMAQRGWFKNEYRRARHIGGGVFNSVGYAYFASRAIKNKRKAPWNLIDPEYAPGLVAMRELRDKGRTT